MIEKSSLIRAQPKSADKHTSLSIFTNTKKSQPVTQQKLPFTANTQ